MYVLTDFLNNSLPFLLLPILTSYLSADDFGKIATFNSIGAVAFIFVGLNLNSAVNVNYFLLSKKEMDLFVSNTLFVVTICFLVLLILMIALKTYVSSFFNIGFIWILLTIFNSYGLYVITINVTLWLAEKRPKSYGIFQISQTVFIFVSSLIFVINYNFDWRGRVLAISLGTLIFSLISWFSLKKRNFLVFKINIDLILDALKFGLPLIPHTLSAWLRNGAIIFILVRMIGTTQAGLFDVGGKISLVISTLAIAVNKAWNPYLYNLLSNNPTDIQKRKIVILMYLFFTCLFLMAIILSFFSTVIVRAFLDINFLESAKFIAWQSFGAAFYGMYTIVVSLIFYKKKTKILAIITITIALLNILLAYTLIKLFGAIGAAQANTIAYILTFFSVWFYSIKILNLPWALFKSPIKMSL